MAAAPHHTLRQPYGLRANSQTHPLARYLLQLMALKKTNLCVSADVTTSAALLTLAEQVGDSICMFKTHCDMVEDWSAETAWSLRELALRKGFCVFEDRKFGDIGSRNRLFNTSNPSTAVSSPRSRPRADGGPRPPSLARGVRKQRKRKRRKRKRRRRKREGRGMSLPARANAASSQQP
ncbi:hypothetical protein GP486_000844 [Trichoglossum hirsutum]|uniref:Orotidine 5'-phosphate decarboxylase n=1 Tax=Trichoglossum hirsutum TaxID=265104 RepID=A0A9P8LHS5_9PEZI|nr:hypothetical protein GP486_000844 [Trichoglossum hirsutum]